MQLAPALALAASEPVSPIKSIAPDAPIEALVDALLPALPGLPGPTTPGVGLGDLVGPPADGSPLAKLDMAAVKGAQLLRTSERDAWARTMANDGSRKLWMGLAKRYRDEVGPVKGWAGTALLTATLATNAAVSEVAKSRYDRKRPYQVDPSIKPPVKLPHNSSYPSGHASAAFAAARVLSSLSSNLTKDAYALAAQVAASRVYAGVHFPTDVVAGALLGTAVAIAAPGVDAQAA